MEYTPVQIENNEHDISIPQAMGISEERFTEIMTQLYDCVHNKIPEVVCSTCGSHDITKIMIYLAEKVCANTNEYTVAIFFLNEMSNIACEEMASLEQLKNSHKSHLN